MSKNNSLEVYISLRVPIKADNVTVSDVKAAVENLIGSWKRNAEQVELFKELTVEDIRFEDLSNANQTEFEFTD